MSMDPRTWTIEYWSLAIAIAGMLFAFTQPFGFLLQWRQYTEDKLAQDSVLRKEWAERLRNGSAGATYRDALARALAWLDRVFGPPGSAQALGVCFLVAVGYAWVTFFLGWGFFHGAGHIGGMEIMPPNLTATQRGIIAALAILLPPAMFYLSHWLAGWVQRHERNVQAHWLKRWKRKLGRHRFHVVWRLLSAGWVFALLMGISQQGGTELAFALLMLISLIPILGGLSGRWVQRYFTHGPSANLASFAAGGLVGAGAGAFAVPGAVPVAVAFAVGGLVGAGAFAGARARSVAFAVTVAFAGAGAGAFAGAVAKAVNVAVAVNVAGAFAGAVGAGFGIARHPSERKGIWAGAVGGMTGLGMLGFITSSKHSHDSFNVLLLLFFLILPLVNSLFDWLSWWTTRILGQRLLAVLDEPQGIWRRRGIIVLHSLADLASSVALLLLMAFALGLGFQAYNDLAMFWHESEPLNLLAVIAATAYDPWGEGFWFTLMLLTTLLPTFGHGIMLLGSPLGLLLIPDRKRLELADELEHYATAGERQPNIRFRAARWHVQERLTHWLLGGVLLVWLLGRVWLLYPLGLIHWTEASACAGVRLAAGSSATPCPDPEFSLKTP